MRINSFNVRPLKRKEHMRTQVVIIGAGPAGLMLGHLLTQMNIDNVIVENQSKQYVESRARAGQITDPTIKILTESGVGSRLTSEGIVHSKLQFHYDGATRELNFQQLSGKTVRIYPQHEIIKDLISARLTQGAPILFGVSDVDLHGHDTSNASVSFRSDGEDKVIECDFIVGCDGYHGVCRQRLGAALPYFSHSYPFAWLAVLAEMEPISSDVIFSNHETGLALLTMRSPKISRIYLQCSPERGDEDWAGDEIWELLKLRLDGRPEKVSGGRIVDQSIVQLRSYVISRMQEGRLFLAGDAAHIVAPTAAKGMNLAISDADILSQAFWAYYNRGSEDLLASYSDTALKHVWRDVQFSHWVAMLMHRFSDNSEFHRRIQLSELDRILQSEPAARNFAELWVGERRFAASA